jgi:hypothetical protein
MDSDAALDLFDRLAVWTRGEQRAPYKPLLVLYALGRGVRGELGSGHVGERFRSARPGGAALRAPAFQDWTCGVHGATRRRRCE